MVRFHRSIVIRADADRVFALVTDVARKARLNPGAEAIRVEQETPGPVGAGTAFRFVLRHGGRVIDYRSRCVAFEAVRATETVSDTDPPFSVRVSVEPTPGGTRLTQEEWFDTNPPRPPRVERKGLVGLLTDLAASILGDTDARPRQVTRAHEAQVEAQLGAQLHEWLEAIKAHLEGDQSRNSSGPG
ncbi:MAG: SRPBCC family protein [Gammaproteobacteria bacterium]|nr:SRPBCC family protein [Gammaproteobacteria bacterium]